MENLNDIYGEIKSDPENAKYSAKNIDPLYYATKNARILIIGQAPGKKAQDTGIVWNDRSGNRLRDWLGIDRNVFYESGKIAVLPMDFISPELAGLVICRRARALPPNGIPVCSAPCRIFN